MSDPRKRKTNFGSTDPLDELPDMGSLGPPSQGPVPRVDEYLAQPERPQGDPLDALPDVKNPGAVATPPRGTPSTNPDSGMMDAFLGLGNHTPDPYGLSPLPGGFDDDTANTMADSAVAGAQGATLNWGDELLGMVGGDELRDSARQRVDLAHQRSPISAGMYEAAGGALPMMAGGGLGVAGNLARAAVGGGVSAAGGVNAEDVDQRLAAGGKGAAIGLGMAAAPMAMGAASSLAGKSAQALGNYADSGAMGTTMRRVGAGAMGSAGAWSNPMHAMGSAGAMMGGSYILPPAVGAVAGPMSQGLQAAGKGLSAASQLAGAGTAAMGRSQDVAADRGSYQGDTMEGQVKQILQTNPQMLGQYAQSFQEAEQNGSIGALIDRLETQDDEFRNKTSPQIRMFR